MREERAGVAAAPALSSKRAVYPWSVVAGGVESPSSVLDAMREDPVVESHYAGISPDTLRPQRLQQKKQGYVSYRIRDKIYWTRKPVTLTAGELVLTDGESMIRGRCGNIVSSLAREPVAPPALEPPETAMDTPALGSQLMATPERPKEFLPETEKFMNPKALLSARDAGPALPSPAPENPMPPAWAAGGISSPGTGAVAVGGGGASSGGSPSNPATPSTPTTPPYLPPAPVPSTPIDVAPPLVLVSLVPPSPPVIPTNPVPPPPTYDFPKGNPPVNPPPPWGPPQYPPVYPPPPVNPPPSDPPPTGPPPSDPPPTSDPPPPVPPGPPPPDVSVPEPSGLVMLLLGIGGVILGSARRKT